MQCTRPIFCASKHNGPKIRVYREKNIHCAQKRPAIKWQVIDILVNSILSS